MFKFHRQSVRLAHSRAAASVESKMATMQHKTFCVEFTFFNHPVFCSPIRNY